MIDAIIRDLNEVPICLVSRRGWGKSSSVKHILEIMKSKQEVIIKVFDSSLSWYFSAPVKWRQIVTRDRIMRDEISNIGDCVFSLSLDREDSRSFIATIIKADLEERKRLALKYGLEAIKSLPLIVYVIEESNLVLASSSLLKTDEASETINRFISEGRNLNTTGFFIVTRIKELSTGIRERCKLLIGQVLGQSDLNLIGAVTDKQTAELTKTLKKYHFLYYGQIERIPDTVKTAPVDFRGKVKIYPTTPQSFRVPSKTKINVVSLIFPMIFLMIMGQIGWVILSAFL